MKQHVLRRAQRGATLVVGLIMLTLVALVVSSAYMLSTGNLTAVGNMQSRDEATAAANFAIEQVMDAFLNTSPMPVAAPGAESFNVDIDNDGDNDYTVNIAAPQCLEETEVAASSASGSGSSASLGSAFTATPSYSTLWDIAATSTDTRTGVQVVVNQGVRVLLTETQKTLYCP